MPWFRLLILFFRLTHHALSIFVYFSENRLCFRRKINRDDSQSHSFHFWIVRAYVCILFAQTQRFLFHNYFHVKQINWFYLILFHFDMKKNIHVIVKWARYLASSRFIFLWSLVGQWIYLIFSRNFPFQYRIFIHASKSWAKRINGHNKNMQNCKACMNNANRECGWSGLVANKRRRFAVFLFSI